MNSGEKPSTEDLSRDEILRFFSVLSHDLKSPIFSIDGFSDLLLSDYGDKLDDEGLDFLRRIRSSAQQIKRVLEEMSHMVKLLTRPTDPRLTDLNELLEEVRLRYNYLIEDGAVTFQVPARLPSIHVDCEKLREAMSALISNALLFNDKAKGERRVDISYDSDGDMFRLCVADNGNGFDERYASQIFDLGIKLDKSRGGGAGYGLYLARRVAESHGGTVEVHSSPGEGSRFCMLFPKSVA